MKRNEQAPGRWHRHTVRVRYQETDRMGVVYHANYINWFEVGRTELIRERGFPYSRIEEMGLYLPVVELESKFHLPARYDDWIAIYTRISAYTAFTIKFESQIRRDATKAFPEHAGAQAGGHSEAASGIHSAERSDSRWIEPEGETLVTGTTRHVWLNGEWKPARLDREAPELYRLLGEER